MKFAKFLRPRRQGKADPVYINADAVFSVGVELDIHGNEQVAIYSEGQEVEYVLGTLEQVVGDLEAKRTPSD